MKTDPKHLKGLLFIATFCSLLTGVLIYSLCRDSDLLIFSAIEEPAFWGNLRLVYPNGSLPLSILAYNVPDGLWMLSGLLFLRAFWLENEPVGKAYVRTFCAIAVLLEGLQWFDRVPGTFDVCDLIAYAVATFVEGVMYTCFVKRRIFYAT